ncbi:MAG: MFS transporter [Alphaproteobacteria bacterium]|nr:MFS transporter [Alphaproteobacteria bacterium]
MAFNWSRDIGDRSTTYAILVCSLGWFVDIFDLILFSAIRVDSLRSLGLEGDAIVTKGALLLNMQFIGMLIGGLVWGIWGDKRGRIEILFGSILLYSIATIANAYVDTVAQYALCRFLAGLGLAGEIGASITLIAELMPKHTRGLGTGFAGAIGAIGGVVAGYVGTNIDWQSAYIIGGALGLILLFTRAKMAESDVFKRIEIKDSVSRGDLRLLVMNGHNLMRYISSILVGFPIFFLVAILMAFSPEIADALNIPGVLASRSITYGYSGLVLGEIAAALISQFLQSRKKVIFMWMGASVLLCIAMFVMAGMEVDMFYFIMFLMGISSGYWVIFNTAAAEQFGTNLRATVATTVPNLVRGSTVISTTLFVLLHEQFGILIATALVGFITFVAAFAGLLAIKESFGIDLNFYESATGKKIARAVDKEE